MNPEHEDNFELDDLSLEIAAAELSIALAEADPEPAMPATLRNKLDLLATEHIATMRARRQETSPGSLKFQQIPSIPTKWNTNAEPATTDALIPTPWRPFVRSLATLAAAACIIIGLGIFYYSVSQSPSAKRESMAARAGTQDGVVRWTWAAWTKDADSRATNAAGDVVWDTKEQGGYMTFTGLPPIDASKEVYQLWIIDADRPGEHPVDGGTFVAKGDGTVIVPFHARIKVGKPAAFAVTIEKPGGVVVSDQKRKLTIAAPAKS
jgi:hypothetical protein